MTGCFVAIVVEFTFLLVVYNWIILNKITFSSLARHVQEVIRNFCGVFGFSAS